MLKNHKAFTLLEILIVTIIAALMIGTFEYFIPKNNKTNKQEFGIKSSIKIYKNIQNTHNKIKRNHTRQFGSHIETIQLATISTTQDTSGTINIQEIYNQNSGYIIISDLKYNNNNYKNIVKNLGTGENIITINKNNSFNNNRIIETQVCNLNGESCIPISQIKFNKAAQTITQNFCINFTGSTCNKWGI